MKNPVPQPLIPHVKGATTRRTTQEQVNRFFRLMHGEFPKIRQQYGNKLSDACMQDIVVLRQLPQWTEELEKKLIQEHVAHSRIDVFHFGL